MIAFPLFSDQLIVWAANVLLQITLVTAATLAMAPIVRRSPAVKYWLHCSALLLVLLCPAIAVVMQYSGKSLLTVSLLQEHSPTANNAISPPVEMSAEPQPTEPPALPSLPDNFAPTSDLPADTPAPPVADLPEDSPEIHAQFDRAIVESNEEANTSPLPEPKNSLAAEPAATSIASTLRIIMRPLLLIWLFGATLLLARLTLGWCRLAAILRTARPNTDSLLAKLYAQVGQQLHLARMPKLVLSDRITAPIAAGLFRPRVVLPTQLIDQVTPERLRDILVHEVAHIKRHDQQIVLLQNLSAAIFWIHPLVKLLNRHLAQAREEVCDNYVLTLTDAPSYGRTLLQVAELVQTARPLPGTVSLFTSRWKLEDRVAGLLDERRNRTVGVTGRGRVMVVAFSLVMTAIVAMGTITLVVDLADKNNSTTADNAATVKSSKTKNGGAATISGRIVMEDGSPASSRGRMYYNTRNESVATKRNDNQNTDRFSWEVPAGTVWLSYFADGYAPAWTKPFELKPGEQQTDVIIVLKPGFSELVRVTDGKGKPLADATVSAHPEIHGEVGGPVREQTTDAKGELILEHLADTGYSLTITAPGYLPLRTAPWKAEPGSRLSGTMLRSQPNTGVVCYSGGSPAHYAKLLAIREATIADKLSSFLNIGDEHWGKVVVTTKSSGRFKLDELTTGSRNWFIVEAGDWARAIVDNLQASQKDARIVLPSRHDLAVKIIGDISNLPKRYGKPFVSVRQSVQSESASGQRFVDLIGAEVPIEITDFGGRAIVRGLAIDLRPGADKQQVEVSLGDDQKTKKTVDMNLTRSTYVEFVLPDSRAKKVIAKSEQAPSNFKPASMTHSPVHRNDHSAIWFHTGKHVHFVLYSQGYLQAGLTRTEVDFPQASPSLWGFQGHIDATGKKYLSRPEKPRGSILEATAINEPTKTRRFPFVFANRPTGLLLYLEGKTYDLAAGRVFVLPAQGEPTQLAIEPPSVSDSAKIDELKDRVQSALSPKETGKIHSTTTTDQRDAIVTAVSNKSALDRNAGDDTRETLVAAKQPDTTNTFWRAPKPSPALKRILNAWRQRENTVRSFQAKWSTTELLDCDQLPHPRKSRAIIGSIRGQPRGDHRYEGEYAFAIDQANRVRNESKREQWSGKLAAFVPIKSVRVFNDKLLTIFRPAGFRSSGQPFSSAEIRQDSFRTSTSNTQTIPLRLIFRPFDDGIGYFEDPKMSLKSGTHSINGTECLKITSGRESLGEYQVVWVENNASYLPVKYTRASNGHPGRVVEIAYTDHEKYGRVPASWKLEMLFEQKEPYLTQSATVSSIQINEPIKDETFTVKFSVGTRVSNSVTNENYIQLKDGKKQPILENEVTGDTTKTPDAATQTRLPNIEFKGLQDPARVVAKLTGRDWGTVTLHNAPWLWELKYASSIRALRIIGKMESDKLPRLEQVNGLIDLQIWSRLDVNDLEAIGRLTQLERLSLPRKLALTVTGARQIARLTKLKSLVLNDVDVDDASFTELATLVNLERLDLFNARITDEGLKTLVHMPKLKWLELRRHPQPFVSQQLSDACLPTVCGLIQLETLSISGSITDEGLTKIATLPRLKDLSISGTKVTGHGLAALKNSTIERLTIKGDLLGSAPSSPEPDTDILTMMPGLANLGQCKHLKNVHVNGKNPPRWAWNRLAPDIEWRY